MSTILSERLSNIKERIQKACLTSNRNSDEVSLLPVSKTKPSQLIKEFHELGCNRFGENKVQEIETKANELSDLSLEFCLIGHLQSNKVNKVARHASEIHTLDSLKIAVSLEKALQKEGRSMNALIQVNTSSEPQKFGLSVDEVLPFARELKSFSSLKIKGLMTLALFSKDENLVRPCFVKLRELKDQLQQDSLDISDWSVLSMGMSQDLEWAIEEGSTEVRIGTDLFGKRD